MGVMLASVPSVKRPMPAISSSTAMTKASMRSVLTGTKKRHRSATMSAIGATDATDSRSFSAKTVLTRMNYPFASFYYYVKL